MENGSEWTVVDLTPKAEPDGQAIGEALKAAGYREPEQSVRAEVLASIRSIVHRRLGVDLTGEFTVDTDPENGDARITMTGLTVDGSGDFVSAEREYEWTGTISITVQVSGTVTARSEDEAEDLARDAMRDVEVGSVEVDGAEASDWDLYDYDFDGVSEV